MTQKQNTWHSLSSTEVFKILESSKTGLSSEEWKKRQSKYGDNALAREKRFSGFGIFLSQFKSALVYILVFAGLISVVFAEYIDAYVIFAAVFLNVIVGFVQEYKANQSLDKLSKVVKQSALVLRDGHEQKVDARMLVPGDVIILQAGDRVAADARLIDVNNFKVNEAPLTGESWPVKKREKEVEVGTVLAERSSMVYTGTLIVEGRATAVVTDTGLQTEIGKITSLLKDTVDEKTPLQRRLNKFAQDLTKLVVIISLIVFALGLIEGNPWAEMFSIAVAVAVSAIPEGLVIGMTMILTVGMQRILKHNGLVRKLVSAETLGSTTVICTDKTGTLTEGEMRVTRMATDGHYIDFESEELKDINMDKEFELMMEIAYVSNDAVVQNPKAEKNDWEIIGSPTEKALLMFGAKNPDTDKVEKKYERLEEIPFDSQIKYMLTRHKHDSTHDIVFLKGAPEKIIQFCSKYQSKSKTTNLTKGKKDFFEKQYKDLSTEGLRVLSGAYKLVSRKSESLEKTKDKIEDFVFVGTWGLSDPLREETKQTLKKTIKAGINTVIITGDNKFTAQRIAKDLGLEVDANSVVTGDELLKMSDKELDDKIAQIKVYARVTPGDKLRIINAWQHRGEVVSMTGDGVNDAPALKAADIGVVVSSGSDVAKETADLVLLDNNFATIVMAIRQGRVIFANIKKVLLYLVSDSFSAMLIVVSSLFLQIPLPIVTAQILWINLISDGFPALALTMEPEDEDIMNAKPRREHNLIGFEEKLLIVVISVLTSGTSLWLFNHFWTTTGDLTLARTVAFANLGVSTLFYVFSVKNLSKSIWQANPFKNKYLNVAVVAGFILQLVAIYIPAFNTFIQTTPLRFEEWQFLLTFNIVTIIAIEVVKAIFISRLARQARKQA